MQPIMDVIVTTRNTPLLTSLKSSLIIPYFCCKVNSFDSSPVVLATGVHFFQAYSHFAVPSTGANKSKFCNKNKMGENLSQTELRRKQS